MPIGARIDERRGQNNTAVAGGITAVDIIGTPSTLDARPCRRVAIAPLLLLASSLTSSSGT